MGSCLTVMYRLERSFGIKDIAVQQVLNIVRGSVRSAFLKLFSSGDHFYYSECSTDHPTLVPFESKFIIFLNVLSIC
jgi:hypothetical protein